MAEMTEDRCDEIHERSGYFTRQDGVMIFYEDIAQAIKTLHPELVGKHIFAQLNALGLWEAMQDGSTPCMLPYSFTL